MSEIDEIEYSEKYYDKPYEYRHVKLPKHLVDDNLSDHLLSPVEWRSLGVQMSRGWQHYMIHRTEPHVLLFRRARGTNPQTGNPPPGWAPPELVEE